MNEKDIRAVTFLLQEIKNEAFLNIGIEHVLRNNTYPNLDTLCRHFGKLVERCGELDYNRDLTVFFCIDEQKHENNIKE